MHSISNPRSFILFWEQLETLRNAPAKDRKMNDVALVGICVAQKQKGGVR